MSLATARPVYALTLHRPWPWAIFQAGRPVESRSWFPPVKMLPPRSWLAIHAGKGWDQRAPAFISARKGYEPPGRERHPSGVIVGAVEFLGAFDLGSYGQAGRLLKITRGDHELREEIVRWSSPEHGRVTWVLGERVEFLQPITASGRQGLWRLSVDEEREFLEQLRGDG